MEPSVSRRERQREQINVTMARGDYARALVLAREHLAEFPDDEIVRAALVEAREALEQPAPGDRGSG